MPCQLNSKDLEYFRRRVLYWKDRLGLTQYEWRVMLNGKKVGGNLAQVHYNTSTGNATVFLQRSFGDGYVVKPSRHELERTALHEVVEVVLDPLVDHIQMPDGYWKKDEIVHSVVMRIVNLILGDPK